MKGRGTIINKQLKHEEGTYGLILLKPDGQIEYMNKRAKKLMGAGSQSEPRNIFRCFAYPEINKKLHDCIDGACDQFVAHVHSKPYLFLFHKADGHLPSNQLYLYIFSLDQLKKLEDHNNWNESLLTSIGEMSAGIAHEVRNPLTAVKGFLQLLDQSYKPEYIEIAQSELERAITILNELMSVSKPEFDQEKRTTFSIVAEIESILLLFQNQLYNIRVIKKLENPSAVITGRKSQIKKALFNIVKNAIEAMPDGGILTIEQYEDHEGVHITIADTGVGIPKDKLRMLGTPFFSLKEDGTGMGVAQVFSAMQNNNASVQVKSEEGKGTAFCLHFPKGIQHLDPFSRRDIMTKTISLESELTDFLIQNVDKYAKQWVHYLNEHKSYYNHFHGNDVEEEQFNHCKRFISLVVRSIPEIKAEEIMEWSKDLGISRAKTDFPIHLAWEFFQSSRSMIWEAIHSFYQQSNCHLVIDEFFSLERKVNNIIDMMINSYTAYYVQYKDELLKSQRETVDELSVPVIPITDKICILPIVGNVDTYRAKKIREKTLFKVKEFKARKLIIDVSGVPFVDTAVVNHLFKIVKGIKLLGCSTILTGISPEIADTMIELGIDIDEELETRSDLQQALQEIGFDHASNHIKVKN
jgi:rsbT co-antagonist protein RsbR